MQYADYCTSENLKRRNWFSRTYTAKVSVQSTALQSCDLIHMQIPFNPEDEAIAMRQFHIQKEELQNFYEWLWARIKTNVSILRFLNRGQVSGVTALYAADVVQDGDIKHIYLITPPYRKYFDSVINQPMDLSGILGAAIRVSNLIRDLASAGVAHGNICMESLYIDQEGKIILGDFYYGSTESIGQDNPYSFLAPPHVPEYSLATGRRSPEADLSAMCSMLWNMLSEFPADLRTPLRTAPPNTPQGVIKLLLKGMGEPDLPTFRKELSDVKRATGRGAVVNKQVIIQTETIPQFAAKEYVPEITEEDVLAAVEANAKTIQKPETKKGEIP